MLAHSLELPGGVPSGGPGCCLANRRRGLPLSCMKTICCALGFVVLMGKVLVLHWPRPALTLVHCPVSSLSTPGLYQAIWVPGAWTGLSHYSSVSWDRTVDLVVVWFLFPVVDSGGVIPFLSDFREGDTWESERSLDFMHICLLLICIFLHIRFPYWSSTISVVSSGLWRWRKHQAKTNRRVRTQFMIGIVILGFSFTFSSH